MLGKLAGTVLLVGVLSGTNGWCASVAPTPSDPPMVAQADNEVPLLPPPAAAPESTSAMAAPVPTPSARVALLLPLRSESLGSAAEAVRDGFMAAHQRDPEGAIITTYETGDAAQDTLSGYAEAAAGNDIVVGPLSRTDVTAIALSRAVSKPTIALTQPDLDSALEGALPRQLLVIALSIEDESRQVASWAAAGKKSARAFVISTTTAWQRRAAKAFAGQWKKEGMEAQSMELSGSGGTFSASSLAMLKKRLLAEKPALLFLALDTAQARQVRAAVGNEIALYGTSQLNPFVPQERDVSDPTPDMDGVRLLDLPWQIELDDPAVMVYPRAEANPDLKRSADLERLYGLGIDAYRIAREIALHRTQFDLDGVTGKLSIGFGTSAARFSRVFVPAYYRDGVVVPLAPTP